VNGTPDFGGFARTSADSPETAQSPTKEMYIASISKTISAVAMLKVLQDAGIPVTADIAPYLPSSWTQGPNVDDITFEHLMSHQSGLEEAGDQTMEALESAIASGTPGILDFEDAVYTNTNFSLIRILLPQILIGEDVIETYVGVLGEAERPMIYAELYAQYVGAEVLAPAGINAPACAPREATGTRTLYYNFGDPATEPGLDLGDWGLRCGATGYYLSAVELGSLLAHMRYTDDIIDESIRDLMNNEFLGWLNPIVFAPYVDSPAFPDEEEIEGDWGLYRAHGGDSSNSNDVQGMTSCMMNYPIQVEAVLLINSRGNAVSHPCGVLLAAFDNAWVAN
jgi:CubicO group peptidase (beta-lactamase class C family)